MFIKANGTHYMSSSITMVEEREVEGQKYFNVYTDIVKLEDNTLAFFRLYENGSEGSKVDHNSPEDYMKIRDLVYLKINKGE